MLKTTHFPTALPNTQPPNPLNQPDPDRDPHIGPYQLVEIPTGIFKDSTLFALLWQLGSGKVFVLNCRSDTTVAQVVWLIDKSFHQFKVIKLPSDPSSRFLAIHTYALTLALSCRPSHTHRLAAKSKENIKDLCCLPVWPR